MVDSLGNRTSKKVNGNTTNYTYNDNNNRLIKTTDGLQNQQFEYEYDDNGSARTMKKNGKTYNIERDIFGRIVNYKENSNILSSFVYDGEGKRVKKVANGKTTIYHYNQSGSIICETDESGKLKADYIYLSGKLVGKIGYNDR